MRARFRELHEGVGVAAGGVNDGKRTVPVVVLSFVKDDSALVDLQNGIYDPDDGRWHNFALSIRAARQLLGDLKDVIDEAIKGAAK